MKFKHTLRKDSLETILTIKQAKWYSKVSEPFKFYFLGSLFECFKTEIDSDKISKSLLMNLFCPANWILLIDED